MSPPDKDREIQAALSAFASAKTIDDLDRAYVEHVPPLEPYIDDDALRSMTFAFNIRRGILRNEANE